LGLLPLSIQGTLGIFSHLVSFGYFGHLLFAQLSSRVVNICSGSCCRGSCSKCVKEVSYQLE
jgi:hypothetical protein